MNYDNMKRGELVAEAGRRFGKAANIWIVRSGNAAIREALTTGVEPVMTVTTGNGAPMTAATTGTPDGAALLAQMSAFFAANVKASVDAETVAAMIETALDNRPAAPSPTITIQVGEMPERTSERKHYLFPLVLALAANRIHCYLVGPAGSFKTSVAKQVATELGLEFSSRSVSSQTSETAFLGFMQPQLTGPAVYVATEFRKRFEHGGVFLLDEIDNGNANVIAVLNSALANGEMAFPDGMVQKHKDFVLIAAANTYGTGAGRVYVGRNQLDGATLDRFAFVDFPYDEALEMTLCGRPVASPVCDLADGGAISAPQWCDRVQAVRAAVATLRERIVVSPRASFYGAQLAAAGIGRAWLEKMLLWRGTDAGTVEKIKAEAK